MVNNLDGLLERVDRIEGKLDALASRFDGLSSKVDELSSRVDGLSSTVDRRFDEVDKRFEAVDQHFVEQREYTEFAYERLERSMAAGFDRLERKLDQFLDGQSRPTARRRPPRSPKRKH